MGLRGKNNELEEIRTEHHIDLLFPIHLQPCKVGNLQNQDDDIKSYGYTSGRVGSLLNLEAFRRSRDIPSSACTGQPCCNKDQNITG